MSILEASIGWLAPPHCVGCGQEGHALCKACTTSYIIPYGEKCWRCNSLSPGSRTCPKCRHVGSPSFVWITTSHENLARELLSLYKFGHQRVASDPIAEMMAETFSTASNKHSLPRSGILVIPIPTATARVRERSFGHSELLARNIATRLGLERSNALSRLGQTRQLGSKREDRLTQLDDSFVLKQPRKVQERKILLIDDVVTTGGTLIAATKILRSAGAKQVNALVFAKRL